jgi:hypothetical protein
MENMKKKEAWKEGLFVSRKLGLITADSRKNEYNKINDGFFTYYVNTRTGEKKFSLDEGDIEVERHMDDFIR